MRAVVQRVSRARVTVAGEAVGEIGRGVLVLLGVRRGDGPGEVRWMAEKVTGLRIFEDSEGKMNLALADAGGAALVVSQFTIYGDCQKGRRPSFTDAAPPAEAEPLYDAFLAELRSRGVPTAAGVFGAMMQVELVNDGPVTLVIDSPPPGGKRE